MSKLFIFPKFSERDTGEGGIKRVVEAQKKYLPQMGFEIVENIEEADICSYHGGEWIETNLPVVMHCHGLYWAEYQWGAWAHELNNNVVSAMHRADAVTAPSHWVAYALQRGMHLNPVVLYHGVDAEDWHTTKVDGVPPYVLWNKTRPDPVCDPEPVTRLARSCHDISFVSTFGVEAPNVKLTGRLPYLEAKKLVESAGVYLCTTRETFGIGTLEAMAAGVPILGWNWGGQAEIIEHEQTGYLARVGDYDELERGLRFCLENRAELGARARHVAANYFSWQSAMQQYATLYRQVLRRRAKDGMRPKVSVVITCYNLANTLGRAVDSVVKQEEFDPREVEIIVVNDNSPDDTQEVAEALVTKHKKHNIKVVRNETNLYLASALNAGISASSGRYIVPLDADNELGPAALRLLSDPLDKGYKALGERGPPQHVDITYGAMEVIDEAGINPNFVSGWPAQFNYVEQMRKHNQIPSTSMYRRSVWQSVNGYRRRCHTAEDADFWCRATSFGSIPRRVTDAVTLKYHDRSDSMSHTQADWDWAAWYTWGRIPKLTPFGAARGKLERTIIPSYEPALISVIIPVGPGHQKYLIDALDSLEAQTFQQWRVIVINDTEQGLGELPPFVKVLDTGGNKGPALARNMGIAASTTPLWLPLDADDYLQPDALEKLYIAWKNDPSAYVFGDWYVQETGEFHKSEPYNCEALLRQQPHAVTALYTKHMWLSIGGFDNELQAWEDWDFLINLAAHGFCGSYINTPVFQYRMQAGTRRESMYAARESLKETISNKWSRFIIDREPLMACGSCGQRNRAAAQTAINGSANAAGFMKAATVGAAAVTDGTIKLEYTGPSSGPVTYKGQVTGNTYRFGGPGSGHTFKYVYQKDAVDFLARSDEFKVAEEVEVVQPVLAAAGPPSR